MGSISRRAGTASFLTLGVAIAAVGSLVAAVNCASQTARDGFDAGAGMATGGSSGSGASSGSSSGPGGGGAIGIGHGDAGAGSAGSDGGACAATVSAAKIVPVILVFMFDRSGSMGDSIGNGQTKWTALVPGLETFFADPKSKGISASLQFFMQTDECDVDAYAAPLVPITALPSSVFAQAINAVSPAGETPTQPALQGALQYASQELAQNAGARVAVVLVTDGEPNGCSSTVPNVASTAAASAPGIPTYVIGIGKPTDLVRLATIAEAGATSAPFFVQPDAGADDGGCGDAGCAAEVLEQEFESALAVIRGATISCNLQLPMAPSNQSLDFGKVNVEYTGSNGSANTLLYNQSCGGNGLGWAYDDPNMPSRIQICPASCATIQGDTLGATLDIALGCATQTAQ